MMDWLTAPEHAHWVDLGISVGGRLLGALVLLLVGLKLAHMLANWIGGKLQKSRIESTAALFLGRIILVVLQVVLLLAVVQVLGVPMTSMFAVLGAAGLAIGLALKDSLSNIASGVMLVTLRPFHVDDIVTINGVTGKVEMVNIFQTRLRGADNQVITLPNSLITNDSIINLTPDTMRRIELVIGIGYSDDIDKARAIAMDAMQSDPRVLAEPEPSVFVYELAESSVNLGIRCHVANADWFATRCELTEQVKKRFDKDGISIPFPQRDLHLVSGVPSLGGKAEPKAA
ncbi:mechanosensitive ion channel family protein [Dokdonella immobilis]|uniref:Small-conductance mechanosensitive channel n=1 Tax=Dokdonella immobilis TaxID=578942 RepID=A0A1I4W065_9GAMM|nr:mechanosensitive ion channel family protein [Dokdonella immobilis]SFN06676.1 small conductance mechanosensitive channel [Dokdonella immobilis]